MSRVVTFCRYVGFGVFAGVVFNAHTIWHLNGDTSAAMQQQLRDFLTVEQYLDSLEARVKILELRPARPPLLLPPAVASKPPQSKAPVAREAAA